MMSLPLASYRRSFEAEFFSPRAARILARGMLPPPRRVAAVCCALLRRAAGTGRAPGERQQVAALNSNLLLGSELPLGFTLGGHRTGDAPGGAMTVHIRTS